MKDYQRQFLDLCVRQQILRFGDFTLKSGRRSPYFFNAGRFNSGGSLKPLGEAYAHCLVASGLHFDLLFGPAYKGITLAATTAVAMAAHHDRDLPFCYDRKEVKDHGEGGRLVGAPLEGRVVIIDDVISSGTSIRAAAELIADCGAELTGVALALDREERGFGERAASDEIRERLGVPVVSIINLQTLIDYLAAHPDLKSHRKRIVQYRAEYGVSALGNP